MKKRIPISAAEDIAKKYGYDQVLIYARKTGDPPEAGEHMTTYGINKAHCSAMAQIGRVLQKFMGWTV